MFRNPLPGVPAVESPFFDHIFADPGMDAETRRIANDLRENGYAVLDFPDPDFAIVAAGIKSNLERHYDWKRWREVEFNQGIGMRIHDAFTIDAGVRRLATNAAILALLGRLYGRHAFPFQTLNFPVGTQQHYHSDTVHFNSVPERFMCGVWTALEDIHPDAGPLFYFPGSHRWPIYTPEHIGMCAAESEMNQMSFEPMWRSLVETYQAKPQTFLAKKGQCLIWLANLLHGGSRQNDITKTRWSQVTHYFFEDCAYLTPMFSDPIYGNIAFRELTDICTGKKATNRYLGRDIDPKFIHATSKAARRGDTYGGNGAGLPAGFDATLYLKANPDVARAGVDAAEHYLRYGRKEGRSLR
jgi:hypothetical protein